MTTDYERGRIAGIEAAAGIFDGEAAAMRADELDIAATIFEKHAELVRALLPPASPGAGGEPGPTVTTWRFAVEGLLHEWDKLTRHGSPMTKSANEAIAYARKLMAMPYPSPTTGEPGTCPKCGAAPDERWDCCEVHALTAPTTPEPRGCPTPGAVTDAKRALIDAAMARHLQYGCAGGAENASRRQILDALLDSACSDLEAARSHAITRPADGAAS